MGNHFWKIRNLGIAGCTFVLLIPATGWTQQRPTIASQEYRFASSPLPGGGTVTMQSIPGNPKQSITTVSGLPAPASTRSPATVPTSGRSSVLPARSQMVTPGNISFQSPTLGIGPSRPRVLANDCNCKATEQTAFQVGSPSRVPPPLNLGADNAIYALPSNGLVTPNNQFEPTKYQNLPPGTYMGKGIFGEPRSYVDGEPLRNMMRFLSL